MYARKESIMAISVFLKTDFSIGITQPWKILQLVLPCLLKHICLIAMLDYWAGAQQNLQDDLSALTWRRSA